ncbi:hydrogen gas-evolving membrane-bound hydrogenase subunit E [Hydrogenophaga sp.]|uniref:hydrogen gas-evolving membrane-bound hydrogenase subunit E n=1 Tax=Hydrogenophaga sp. TaxID=1904254 RepID=UPI002637A970|nr:hydrogen gas-evolving membrane-bound hydrogenase subunit E [Hydrogenophaga sp.]MDM7949673.1 proton-conducting transporter membrane subunit [Hydrogenophaga sp.]
MAQAHSLDASATSLGWPGRAAFIAVPVAALCLLIWLLWRFELPLQWAAAWVPALGVEFSFYVDGLSALMLLMITGVGSAVFVYAGGYLAGHPQQHRLYILLSLFMVAMIGCVTADNLIVLFLFWEMTSLTSFMLVGFNHEQPDSRKSAQQALLVTGTGGLVLLAGFIVLGQAMGSWSMSEIVLRLPEMEQTPQLTTALVLILVGAFTKSAQFPFHFWLPNAMSAPTPVSAYLHSATMVKLGVFLLARLDPGFGEWALWEWALKGAGSITAAWGMALALRERDLKRILAWSTVATLGTLVMLVGLRGEGATVAVGALLLAHALYKAPLFFVAGNVDHGTGTRVIDKLGSLRHAMPWTAAVALLAGASMAGMPLSFGYIAKDLILEAKASGDVFAFATAAYTVFGAIAVAVAGVAAIRIFWRPRSENLPPPDAHEGGPSLVGPPLALALIGMALGVFPFLIQGLISDASLAMTPDTQVAALSLALDLGPALSSLAVTLAIGGLIYVFWDPLHRVFERLSALTGHFGMISVYERSLKGIPQLAAGATRWIQGGSLPSYTLLTVSSLSLALLMLLLAGWGQWVWPAWEAPSVGFVGACLLIIAGAVLACGVRNRLVLLLATGLVGFGCGVLFLFTGAPDVAYTQFVVETVFVIVVASVLIRLKRQGRGSSLPEPALRPLALAVALLAGAVLTALLLLATAGTFDTSLTDFFAARSVPEAFGRNVVNVILVDFRALDTLGEITVVMLSFLAAWPLLQALRGRRTSTPKGGV